MCSVAWAVHQEAPQATDLPASQMTVSMLLNTSSRAAEVQVQAMTGAAFAPLNSSGPATACALAQLVHITMTAVHLSLPLSRCTVPMLHIIKLMPVLQRLEASLPAGPRGPPQVAPFLLWPGPPASRDHGRHQP